MLEPMTRLQARWRHEDLRDARHGRQGAYMLAFVGLALAVGLVRELVMHPDVLWTAVSVIVLALVVVFVAQDLRASTATQRRWLR